MNNDVELIPVKGVLPSVQVQLDNVIYVPQAHKNKAGIVKEGDGVLIENGVVSLNKQTVEDMIDANKWVSYGFQQNLTEDEKGMARHNIGAGDNEFTGSYYDVTQKPHLNTDNIDSLDTGDEEINNTINLHKVSKTGSFDDLNDVPTDTLDFAESERQKSKNLFNATTAETTDGYSITYSADTSELKINGAYTDGARCMFNTWSLKKGTYTLCIKFVSGSMTRFYAIKFMLYKDKSWTQYASCPDISSSNQQVYVTFTLTEDVYDARLGLYENLSTNTMTNCVFEYQIVAGSVPDFDFQAYQGGEFVQEGDVADVEHIEMIYEMNTKNTIGGTVYTAGIPFSNISISNVDFNKYKYLRFTCRWNEQGSNWFGGTITFDLDLKTPYNSDLNYISVISNRPSNCYATDSVLTFDLVGFVRVNIDKNGLDVLGYKITYTGERTAYTPDNYLPYFRIEKIEGVY